VFNRTLNGDEMRSLSVIDIEGPDCSISKPRDGFLYIGNEEKFPFNPTIVVGPRDGITVQVEAENDSEIDEMRLFIDDKAYAIATWNPMTHYYEHEWIETDFGFHRLKAEACDVDGNCKFSEEIGLYYFNIKK
jgi:hypothetical protein